MATNTYGALGGVTSLVKGFTETLTKMGHQVMVVAPGDVPFAQWDATGVLRVPSARIGEFDAPFATGHSIVEEVVKFGPDIVHSHHPFLLGSAALSVARELRVPIVYGYNTLYEHYTHNVGSVHSRFPLAKLASAVASYGVARLVPVAYANKCDALLVPTASVAKLSADRGARVPIFVVPYGINAQNLQNPDASAARRKFYVPQSAFVVGHVGRFSREKNLPFLAMAISLFLLANPSGYAMIVGKGPVEMKMRAIFQSQRVSSRVRWLGVQRGQDLANAFASMDVFAFSSTSETQGIVLAEAMAVGAPVIALDAAGTRDIIKHGVNGLLLDRHDPDLFSRALLAWSNLSPELRAGAKLAAQETGRSYSLENTTARLVQAYESVLAARPSV